MLPVIVIFFLGLTSHSIHSLELETTWEKFNQTDMADFHGCEIFLYSKYISPYEVYLDFFKEDSYSNQPISELLNLVLSCYILQNM